MGPDDTAADQPQGDAGSWLYWAENHPRIPADKHKRCPVHADHQRSVICQSVWSDGVAVLRRCPGPCRRKLRRTRRQRRQSEFVNATAVLREIPESWLLPWICELHSSSRCERRPYG